VIGSLPEMGLKETKQAIQAAYDTFNGPWRDTTEYERAAMLTKLFG
jgi:acyl-CoA reductase-like NAD-dependent aldehyde dehydrogenase